MRNRDRSFSWGVALVGVSASLLPLTGSLRGIGLTVVIIACLVVGLVRVRRRLILTAGILAAIAVAVRTIAGLSPAVALGSVLALTVGYDAARYDLSLQRTMGTDVSTLRIRVIHTVSILGFGAAIGGIGYGAYISLRQVPRLVVPVLALGAALFVLIARLRSRSTRAGG